MLRSAFDLYVQPQNTEKRDADQQLPQGGYLQDQQDRFIYEVQAIVEKVHVLLLLKGPGKLSRPPV